jgi:hypothetical protein
MKVAKLQMLSPELITELEEAKHETRFSLAVEKIKHAIPEILQINGNNPLTLLYKALSEELHAGTDEECLEIAQDIRVVLSELSERLHTALKDDQELKKAVSRIQNRPKKGNELGPPVTRDMCYGDALGHVLKLGQHGVHHFGDALNHGVRILHAKSLR